jgi:2'-5' RNA ligase
MEQIRAFIAIELPSRLKLELGKLQTQLKMQRQNWVKWVDPNSIHLTLKFLGNIDINSTGQITKEMEGAARGISPFFLEVKDLGVFPNLRRVQVAWVGVSGEIDKVVQLQQNLESNLEYLGFVPEKRRFTPHLTLARLRDQAKPEERQKFGQLIASTGFKSDPFKVDTVSLMRSQLTNHGAVYSQLNIVQLLGLPVIDSQ